MERVEATTQAVPIGVSGIIVVGLPVDEWILIGTGILLIFNLSMAGRRFYREVLKRGTG
jgi:hypothetical protein